MTRTKATRLPAFGKMIRRERKEQMLTQEALARRASLSLNGIRQIETGERVDPHYSTLEAIAHALDMSVMALIREAKLYHD